MTCGIYCITNLVNGKQYIGQSVNIERRFKDHILNNSGSVIHNAIVKYGKNNFRLDILLECPEEDLDEEEEKFIKLYGTFKNGYNCTWGGESLKGHRHSDETKQKMSESQKHRFSDKNNHPFYGKHHSEESKLKIAQSLKDIPRSEEIRRKISKSQNNSGIMRVGRYNTNRCKQGFVWRYAYYVNGKQTSISSISLDILEQKVKAKGLPWEVLDEEKAERSRLL